MHRPTATSALGSEPRVTMTHTPDALSTRRRACAPSFAVDPVAMGRARGVDSDAPRGLHKFV